MQRCETIFVERYPDDFDVRSWGGIETAYWHLATAASALGMRVRFYEASDDLPDSAAAIVPLPDNALFLDPARYGSDIETRVVRVWHDLGPLAQELTTPPPCPLHGERQGRGRCVAESLARADVLANVFFRDEPWTRCFPRRSIIPWAASHVPRSDVRDIEGPVLVQAGKSDVHELAEVIETIADAGVGVRVIFSNWGKLGRAAHAHFEALERRGVEIVPRYDLRTEGARVFEGASCLFLPSRYHETFNFLAAEAVRSGLPVVALSCSGALREFASRTLETVPEVVDLVAAGLHRRMPAMTPSARTWTDVALEYRALLGRRVSKAHPHGSRLQVWA